MNTEYLPVERRCINKYITDKNIIDINITYIICISTDYSISKVSYAAQSLPCIFILISFILLL
jgi:hypothetical protein